MTDKEKLAKLIAEIKRLYNQSLEDEDRQAGRGLELSANVSYGKSKACKELLSFTDTLQEEPVSEDLEVFIIAKYNEVIGSHGEYDKTYIDGMAKAAAIEIGMACAQWQKEQMMKTAVDGKIYETQARSKLKAATIGKISRLKYSVGDKVKLIILKED